MALCSLYSCCSKCMHVQNKVLVLLLTTTFSRSIESILNQLTKIKTHLCICIYIPYTYHIYLYYLSPSYHYV